MKPLTAILAICLCALMANAFEPSDTNTISDAASDYGDSYSTNIHYSIIMTNEISWGFETEEELYLDGDLYSGARLTVTSVYGTNFYRIIKGEIVEAQK